MDTEMIMEQMKLDLENLAKEHEAAADNEHIWALGASDAETNRMHSENVIQHKLLARTYRRMKDHILTLVETYYDGNEY